MQASFSNERLVSDFIQTVCLRPNYIDLLTQAARNKLVFEIGIEVDSYRNFRENPYTFLKYKLSSFAV